MKSITIKVTREDIKAGKYTEPSHCPIALAIKRNFPNAENIFVGVGDIYIDGSYYDFPLRADRKAQRRVNNPWLAALLGGFKVKLTQYK